MMDRGAMSPQNYKESLLPIEKSPLRDKSRERFARIVGVSIAIIGLTNLAQGIWVDRVPAWANLTILAMVVLLLFVLFFPSKSRSRTAIGIVLLIVAFVPGFLSVAMNPAASEKRYDIAILVIFPMVLVYLAARTPKVIGGMAVGAILLGVAVLLAQWIIPDPYALATGRRTPTGNNAIPTGRLLGFAALAAFTMSYQRRPNSSMGLVWMGLGVALVGGAWMAASRGPLLALLVAVVAVLLTSVRLTMFRRLGLVVVLGIAVVIAIRDTATSGSRIATSDGTGRVDLISATWEVAKLNPSGIGWGNLYNYLPGRLISPEQGFVQYPHNVAIEVLSEGGVLAAVLMAAALLFAGRAAYRVRTVSAGALLWGGYVYALIGAMFSSDIVGNRLLWVLCALSVGLLGGVGSRSPDKVGSSRVRM